MRRVGCRRSSHDQPAALRRPLRRACPCRVLRPGAAFRGARRAHVRRVRAGVAVMTAEAFELLAEAAYDDIAVTEVIRPAAVLPELSARSVLAELGLRDARAGGT